MKLRLNKSQTSCRIKLWGRPAVLSMLLLSCPCLPQAKWSSKLRDCSKSINWIFIEVTECGIVENLLLLQCKDRLAGPLCGHLETTPPEDVEKVRKGTLVIHHWSLWWRSQRTCWLLTAQLYYTLMATSLGTFVEIGYLDKCIISHIDC